jgi:hypothetical protein
MVAVMAFAGVMIKVVNRITKRPRFPRGTSYR